MIGVDSQELAAGCRSKCRCPYLLYAQSVCITALCKTTDRPIDSITKAEEIV